MSDNTCKGRNFSMRAPRPDDRIFSRGFVIGSIRPTGIVKRTTGAFHDQADSATIVLGYRKKPADE